MLIFFSFKKKNSLLFWSAAAVFAALRDGAVRRVGAGPGAGSPGRARSRGDLLDHLFVIHVFPGICPDAAAAAAAAAAEVTETAIWLRWQQS